jgi:hypothetical protein
VHRRTVYLLGSVVDSLAYDMSLSENTGMLAPFNNTIAISLDEEQPSDNVIARFLEWEGSRAPTTLGSDNNISNCRL